MNKRLFLIKESLKRKVFSRWFIIINTILFLLIFFSFHIDSIITFFGGDFKEEKNIIVLDEVGVYPEFKKEFLRTAEFAVTKYNVNRNYNTSEELKELVQSNSNNIGIEIIPDSNNLIQLKVYSLQGLSTINRSIITSTINNIKKQLAMDNYNISQDIIKRIEKDVEVESIVLSDKVVNENKDVTSSITVIVFVVPAFFLITTLIQMVGSEINEEKTTKSMEIIISNVNPKDHLLSKIISCGVFTLIQVCLLLIFTLISFFTHSHSIGTLTASSTSGFTNSIIGQLITPELINMALKVLPILFISFIITLITYALLAGVLASMTTNIDDFQQLQTPVMMIISFSFYLALMAALFEGSLFIKIMSFVPLISFLVSPTLYMLGQISIGSVIISTIIELLFMIIVYHYGIKIYRIGILNYSGDHLWKKFFKALK